MSAHTCISVIKTFFLKTQLFQVSVTTDGLNCTPTAVSMYAVLRSPQANETGTCFIAYGVGAVHIRKLCHVPRALTLHESSVEDPGFCSREDALCVKNTSLWKVWGRKGERPKGKKNREIEEGS